MACGACSKRAGRQTFVHIAPNGAEKVYASKAEAEAAAIRKGGSVKAQ